MRSKHSPRKAPSPRHHKRSPAAEAYLAQELKLEIRRLKTLLRDPAATRQEKAKVQLRIAEFQEIACMAPAAPADWLRQMHLLAE